MKREKTKLTVNDILDFFASKPVFDRSEKDSLIKFGWPSTKEGLYNISDFYSFFEEKGFDKNDVQDVFYKFLQLKILPDTKLEKGKTHFVNMIYVTNYNPDYRKNKKYLTAVYYYMDITDQKAKQLKSEYESESLSQMQIFIDKKNTKKTVKSAAKQQKETKKITKSRLKKTPKIEILAA
jgi:hypothetical protein